MGRIPLREDRPSRRGVKVTILLLAAILAQEAEATIEGLTLTQLRSVLESAHSTTRDRCAAIVLLGRLGSRAAPAVPDLVSELRHDRCDPAVTSTLKKIGQPAVPALLAALEDPDGRVALSSAMALDSIGLPAAGGLVRASKSRSEFVRVLVCWPLGGIGSRHPQAVPTLLALAKDAAPSVRRHAVVAFGRVREVSPSIIEQLRLAVHDPDPDVARAALESLARLSPRPVVE